VSSQKLKELISGLITEIRVSKEFRQVYITPDVDTYF
jgi:hypothetical protein